MEKFYEVPRKYQRVAARAGVSLEQYLAVLRVHSPALVKGWERPDVGAEWMKVLKMPLDGGPKGE